MDPNQDWSLQNGRLESSLERDHERLDGYIEYLDEVLADEEHDVEFVDAALIQLIDEVERHFRREEAWMKSLGYPGIGRHSEQHVRLLQALEDFRRGFMANPTRANAFVIRAFIEDWLLDHMERADQNITTFARCREGLAVG